MPRGRSDGLSLFSVPDEPQSTATFAPCRTYRYSLWRRWGDGPAAMFVGLNPSTADEIDGLDRFYGDSVNTVEGHALDYGRY